MYLFTFPLWVLMIALIVLDILDKLPLAGVLGKLIGMIVLPHAVVLAWLGLRAADISFQGMGALDVVKFILFAAPICLLTLYWLLRIAVKPYKTKLDKSEVNVRVRAMYGGKYLLKYTAVSLICQTGREKDLYHRRQSAPLYSYRAAFKRGYRYAVRVIDT